MTTLGIPGMFPVMMSSRLGLVADVMATLSPSQDRPTVIHRTCASTASVVAWLGEISNVAITSLLSQQIRGSGSPTSWSMTRRPPKAVSTRTTPGGSVRTSPISAASPNPSTERSAASAASA